ncbi:hypothetical protein BGZ98_006811 [Dissophora globulifera]|nr:hypothetical protein BGZ98_006811 [Dissophora globulifera]
MDPVSGRAAHSPSATIASAFPISVPHPYSKMQNSSSIPSPPEHHFNSMKVKTPSSSVASSLDHAILPNKAALSKFHAHDLAHDHQSYPERHHHYSAHYRPHDHDHASSTSPDGKHPHNSRINIANLLCTSDADADDDTRMTDASQDQTHLKNHRRVDHPPRSHQQPQQQQPQVHQHQHREQLRAISEEADERHPHLQQHQQHQHYHHQQHHHQDRAQHSSYPSSYSNGTGRSGDGAVHDSHYGSSSNGNGVYTPPLEVSHREPTFPHRDADALSGSTSSLPASASSAAYRASHADRYPPQQHSGTRPASFSAASSSSSSGPLYSVPPSSSASASYTAAPRSTYPGSQQRSASWNNDRYQDYSHSSYELEHQRRMDRSNSDYALHQQNYGPYLDSPPLSSATLPKPHVSSSETSSRAYPASVSTKAATATDGSAPLYYHSSPPSSAAASYPYSSTGSGRVTPTKPRHEYTESRQGHGPMLPPPSSLLGAVEGKPQRVYGRDSTVDDNWTPVSRATRVVPIDAPNESRPYAFPSSSSSSAMLPPPYLPSSSSSSSKSMGASSSSHLPYPSTYSTPPVEPKPRRVYGIDAADVPQRLPPPAPSASYGSGSYSKPLQHIPDDPEGEDARRRSMEQSSTTSASMNGTSGYSRPYGSGMTSAYVSQAYGYNGSSSHHYSHSDREQERASRYDYDNRGWKSSQPAVGHGSSSTAASSSSYAPSRPYSRPQSPSLDIKPPTWYQNYAHSVPPPKSQSQSSYHHSDSQYYSAHSHHLQTRGYSPHEYANSSDPTLEHDYEPRSERNSRGRHRSSSLSSTKRSKSAHSASQSVHPFDTADKSSKSKKPKRIKNPGHDEDLIVFEDEYYAVKAKRKRANASQLSVLNAAFERSYFPSTEERLRLSKQCRMCPRTVQIWFQNKRQSVKAKSEAMEAAMSGGGDEEGETSRRGSGEDDGSSSTEGQKRPADDHGESGEGSARRHLPHMDDKRRSSGPGTMIPSEAVMSALHIQLDGRSVDYFSRKRRATIAKMEQNEQQKQQKNQQKQQQQEPQQERQQDQQPSQQQQQ